uniref:Uncharacterized protein n=1 Tax=Rhizophora mucronata TaxID=61149 RepID=A0A2P2NXR6_RHIMU
MMRSRSWKKIEEEGVYGEGQQVLEPSQKNVILCKKEK